MKNTTHQKIAVILLALIGMFLTPVLFAENEPTVLERVKRIEDPDLSSLIHIATEKDWPKETNKAKLIQIITEQYAQIKLLDEKIKQLNKKIDESKNPKDIEYELILAKSSLETERLTKLSQLRETLNLIPNHPFGFKDTKEINTWISLEVYDGGIRFINFTPPFQEILNYNSSTKIVMLKPEETINHIKTLLDQKNVYPLRITISSVSETKDNAQKIRAEIQNIIKKQKAEYDADMPNIKLLIPHINELFLLPEKVISDMDSLSQTSNVTNRSTSLDRYIKEEERSFKYPGSLPVVYKIKYYSGPCQTLSPEVAKKNLSEFSTDVITELRNMINRLGYENYITVVEE